MACDDSGGDAGSDGGVAAGGAGSGGATGGGGNAGGGAGGAGGGPGAGAGGLDGGASCMDDDGCPAGGRCDTDAGVCRPFCRTDFDCGGAGRFCDPAGFCRPPVRCSDDPSVCGAGEACNCEGFCEIAGNACQNDLQCAVDEFCDPCAGACKARVEHCGRCRVLAGVAEQPNPCERRTDTCHPVGPEGYTFCLRGCEGQGNCAGLGPGFECQDLGNGIRACVPLSGRCSQPGECENDGDCPSGSFCNDQLACQPGCTGDDACPMGTVCEVLRCIPPCTPDSCPAGGECQPDGHCRIPGGCVTSRDCLEPETYCDRDQLMCVPGCERDDDCLDGNLECVDGSCRERGCTAAFDCALGQVCDLDSGRCMDAEGRHCEPDCDPMDENACGGAPRACLTFEDDEGNKLGDFCFEPCGEADSPNECPQGFQCQDVSDDMGMGPGRLCTAPCHLRTEN
jgi:hypothetical protein